MTVADRVRLPFRFDAEGLAIDAAALPLDAWVPHFNTNQYEGDWSGAALRVADGSALDLYPDPTSTSYTDGALLDRCPNVRAALAHLRCPLQTVRFLRLGPGSRILSHRDYRLGFADGEVRLHVPVTSDQRVRFTLDGREVPMAAGECWYLDLSRPHNVDNGADTCRVHLVIDCSVDGWLDAVIRDAAGRA